jgi:NAD(P)-dependent dehydrogenase (short-subunit alcohol dehydrogenase family)
VAFAWTSGYQIGVGRSLPKGAIDRPTTAAHDEAVEEMQGRIALVTGATGGIGTEIARGLVARGADVIITARDARRGEQVRGELAAAGGRPVEVLPLDVADQSSVRALARTVSERAPRLDVLVNNAGAWYTDRKESPDGIELTLATNVLGPHLLTALLMDRLTASPHARVVNVGSTVAGNLDLADLQFARRPYDGYKAYAQSKQALAMLTWGLAQRMEQTSVCVNVASPGFVRTGFNRNVRGFRAAMINLMARLFATSPAKGADCPLWVATASELDGVTGRWYEGRKQRQTTFSAPGPIAELQRQCDELTGVSASS